MSKKLVKTSAKQYVLSSHVFESLAEIREKMQEWLDNDDLDDECRVFEVVREIKWKNAGIQLSK